jgi:hypothetical protein
MYRDPVFIAASPTARSTHRFPIPARSVYRSCSSNRSVAGVPAKVILTTGVEEVGWALPLTGGTRTPVDTTDPDDREEQDTGPVKVEQHTRGEYLVHDREADQVEEHSQPEARMSHRQVPAPGPVRAGDGQLRREPGVLVAETGLDHVQLVLLVG